MTSALPRRSFREHIHLAREEAILQAACQLLCEKGFDAMTMDDVACAVGIAKASLYKHFSSKEALCCAAMVQVLGHARVQLAALDAALAPIDKLRAALRWSLERLLAQELPLLPSRNSSLRVVLMGSSEYLAALVALSDAIGQWITQAQAQRTLDPQLAPLLVLYTLYARACDPVVGFLKDSGQYQDADIVELVLRTCFDGLAAR